MERCREMSNPYMCIWPLNMNLLSNKKEDLNKISFIHAAGPQLNQQKPLYVFEAIEHVLNWFLYKAFIRCLYLYSYSGAKCTYEVFPAQRRYMSHTWKWCQESLWIVSATTTVPSCYCKSYKYCIYFCNDFIWAHTKIKTTPSFTIIFRILKIQTSKS